MSLACHPRVELMGHLSPHDMQKLRRRSRAIYFPTSIESFGYPLAEARVDGLPVIARDTAQNREIAGPALCGFTPGDSDSLKQAVTLALTVKVAPDPDRSIPIATSTGCWGPRSDQTRPASLRCRGRARPGSFQ